MSFLLYELSESTAVGTAVGPTLTVDMLVVGPSVCQMLFSSGHQHRSIEVRSQDAVIMDTRGPQMEKTGCSVRCFYLSSGRRKQTTSVRLFPLLYTKLKRGFF